MHIDGNVTSRQLRHVEPELPDQDLYRHRCLLLPDPFEPLQALAQSPGSWPVKPQTLGAAIEFSDDLFGGLEDPSCRDSWKAMRHRRTEHRTEQASLRGYKPYRIEMTKALPDGERCLERTLRRNALIEQHRNEQREGIVSYQLVSAVVGSKPPHSETLTELQKGPDYKRFGAVSPLCFERSFAGIRDSEGDASVCRHTRKRSWTAGRRESTLACMELLSLAEASRILGVAHDTLRAQVHRGKLGAIKVGRDWLVTRDEVDRYRTESLRKPRKAR